MENPAFGSDKAVMFYSGDDAGAKQTVKQLTIELGFDAVDAGPLTTSPCPGTFCAVVDFVRVWPGLGREIAFKLMRR